MQQENAAWLGVGPLEFWSLCPRVMERLENAYTERWFADRGISTRSRVTDVDGMQRILMDLVIATGGAAAPEVADAG